jgi:hypothetical protein
MPNTKHPAKHHAKGLVNAVKGMYSTIAIEPNPATPLTGWDVLGLVKDDSTGAQGQWKAVRDKNKGDQDKELRLFLLCTQAPEKRGAKKEIIPDGATLTITISPDSGTTQKDVTTQVDYTDVPPP